MNTISVIVPIFHGKQYISGLLHQVEEAQKSMGQNWKIQTIFVNDAPDDFITSEELSSEAVLVLNTDQNRRVHGARVWGLEHAGIRIAYLIDKNAKYIETEYKAYTLEDELQKLEPVDAVLLSLVQEEQAVSDKIKRCMNVRVLTSGSLIQETGEKGKIW